jgi:hypothetical protein
MKKFLESGVLVHVTGSFRDGSQVYEYRVRPFAIPPQLRDARKNL